MTKNATPANKGTFFSRGKENMSVRAMFCIHNVNLPASLELVYSLHIVVYSLVLDKHVSKAYFS